MIMDREGGKVMCPSARAKEGSRLLGVRQEDGTVAILPEPLPINKQFIEAASHGDPPEQRFRFTNKCVEGGCKQWNGKGCGIAEQIVKHMHRVDVTADLPACGGVDPVDVPPHELCEGGVVAVAIPRQQPLV